MNKHWTLLFPFVLLFLCVLWRSWVGLLPLSVVTIQGLLRSCGCMMHVDVDDCAYLLLLTIGSGGLSFSGFVVLKRELGEFSIAE